MLWFWCGVWVASYNYSVVVIVVVVVVVDDGLLYLAVCHLQYRWDVHYMGPCVSFSISSIQLLSHPCNAMCTDVGHMASTMADRPGYSK